VEHNHLHQLNILRHWQGKFRKFTILQETHKINQGLSEALALELSLEG
jgi:hypothetical protein